LFEPGTVPKSPITVLDTTTLEWKEPKLANPDELPKLVYHSATGLFKHMFVAFGKLFYFILF
jgi:hypothetical protein